MRETCPRCWREIGLEKNECPYCGLSTQIIGRLIGQGRNPLSFALDQYTTRRLITNLIVNTDDLTHDETVEMIAKILAEGGILNLKDATDLVKDAYDKTIQQIMDENYHLDGSHLNMDEATEMCFTSEIDTFIDNVFQGLEKKGIFIF